MLDRKLWRDLGHLKGQVITISLVVAAGLAGLVGMYSTLRSLDVAAQEYYQRYRFADIFAGVERAPESVGGRLESVPGVRRVYTRIVEPVRLPLPWMEEPANGRIVSLPDEGRPPLNDIFLRRGRMPEPGRHDEVLVLESFATAHGLVPGDTLPVVVGGTLRDLRIVGIALSPEFLFLVTGREIVPDEKRSTILWMRREGVAAAFGMEGAFNDIVLSTQPGASEPAVIDEVDRLLDPYGGPGANGRDRHPSHLFLTQERLQLRGTGVAIPLAFLAIAAFLLNVVLARIVQLQRGQIATLKAVGYADRAIGMHFFKIVLVVLAMGTLLGAALGAWMGQGLTSQYSQFFYFPNFPFRFDLRVALVGTLVSLVAGGAGAMSTVYRVMKLPPAEAMRPPSPPTYQPSVLERSGLYGWLSASVRMIVREVERRPARFLLSWLGIAVSVALLVMGRFGYDAFGRLLELQFSVAAREDVSVGFANPVSDDARRELASLPGVLAVESERITPVRVSAGHRDRETAIIGMPADSRLRRVINEEGEVIGLPEQGVLMSGLLGETLEVSAGDRIVVDVLEGERRRLTLRVDRLVDDVFGLQLYMPLSQLNRLLGEEHVITGALLDVDGGRTDEVLEALRDRPQVLSVNRSDRVVEFFRRRLSETFVFMTTILVLVASVMTIGVVYNNARVALSTRGRDLASMRVLGFRRREVAIILLGEQALQVLLAIPIGWWMGGWMAVAMMSTVDPENFRFPIVISTKTYAFSAVVTVAAAIFSGFLVRRRLDRMDLTEVLKTRE